MKAIYVTEDAATIPVFRPLIGMDKEEIVKISRKIETFQTSIQPYEDCCTVFTPKHPRTKPKLDEVRKAEIFENCEEMMKTAIENTVFEKIMWE